MPTVPHDDLGQDRGERELGSLATPRLDVIDDRGDDGAVERDDDLQREVISSRFPEPAEALGRRVAG
jgi:hypothetical protein